MELRGSKTEENLKYAFAGESQANRRYLYFAAKADVEGYNDVAAVFRAEANLPKYVSRTLKQRVGRRGLPDLPVEPTEGTRG